MVFGSANVVGGYVVTDRMLQMFRRRPAAKPGPEAGAGATGEPDVAGQG
jgi:NAD(P) transhydrogenase subunit alpha